MSIPKGFKHTKKTKEKISKALKGVSKPLGFRLGVKHSERTKRKMSKKAKLRGNNGLKYWLGKKRPEITGNKHPFWKGGTSFEPYTTDWTETLKRSIRKRDKYTCRLCEKEPSIIVHHIDYDKKNCDPDNLITLCGKCHSKTNHNRKKWQDELKDLVAFAKQNEKGISY